MSLNNSDNKIEIIKKSKNQEEIIRLAKTDSDFHIRLAAVEYVNDESVLKDILNNDSINAVCINAMEKIHDTDFLVDVCLNNPDSYLRLATLNRILDESLMGNGDLSLLLEKVVLNDPDVLVQKAALENPNFNNQETLFYISKSSNDDVLRRISVSKITNEDVLADFALNDQNTIIRREAIQNPNLKSEDILSDVVKNDCDEFNRYWACQKIENEDILLKIIYDSSFAHCLDIISQNPNLPSNEYFINVYEHDVDEYHRQVAVNFITDSSFLEYVALNESNDKIKAEAIKNKNFNNQEILNDLILSDCSLDVLLEVVLKVNNEKLLIDLIKKNLNSKKLISQAINNVFDTCFLEELCCNDDSEIRCLAVDRLGKLKSNESILSNVALCDNDKNISLKAVSAIDNSNDLIWIAHESQDRDIKVAALNKIVPKRLLNNYLPNELDNGQFFESKLKEMALNDEDIEVQSIAVSKLQDKPTLDNIASSKWEVSLIAKNRLNTLFEDIKLISQEAILKHLIKSHDADVSYVAQQQLEDLKTWKDRISKVSEISDIETLNDIAKNDFNYYVRCEAEGRLEKMLFDIRLDEINNEENQEKLKKIAQNLEFSEDIRNKARLRIRKEHFY